MKILLKYELGKSVEAYVEFVPRLGDNLELFDRIYRVVGVLLYPSIKTLLDNGSTDLSVTAIVYLTQEEL